MTANNWGEGLGPWDQWVGSVCVAMPESDTLEVTFDTATFWLLWEAYLWTGDDTATTPTNPDGRQMCQAFLKVILLYREVKLRPFLLVLTPQQLQH